MADISGRQAGGPRETPVTANTTGWVLTAIFAGAGCYYLAVTVSRTSDRSARTSSAWHLLMCAWMIAMSWSWGMSVPIILTVSVFGLGTLWFVHVGVRGPRSRRHHPAAAVYHAIMMAAMVPMALMMAPMRPGVVADSAAAGMSGMSDHSNMSAMEGGQMMTVAGSARWLSSALAGLFLAAMVWQLALLARLLLVDSPLRGPVLGRMSGILMAAGMALAFYQMS